MREYRCSSSKSVENASRSDGNAGLTLLKGTSGGSRLTVEHLAGKNQSTRGRGCTRKHCDDRSVSLALLPTVIVVDIGICWLDGHHNCIHLIGQKCTSVFRFCEIWDKISGLISQLFWNRVVVCYSNIYCSALLFKKLNVIQLDLVLLFTSF